MTPRMSSGVALMAAVTAIVGLMSAPASAGERYALVVTGASGGEAYAAKYDAWRTAFVDTLQQRFGYPDDHVFILAEVERAGVLKATRENVRRVFTGLRARVTKDDQLLVLLIGHGTSMDGEDGKFNLVGLDLSAKE